MLENSWNDYENELGLSDTSIPEDKPKVKEHVAVVNHIPKRPENDSSSQLKIVNHFELTKISDPTSILEKTILDD